MDLTNRYVRITRAANAGSPPLPSRRLSEENMLFDDGVVVGQCPECSKCEVFVNLD